MGKKKEQSGGSTQSRDQTNNTTDVDATYYNVHVTSAQSHSNEGQGHGSSGQGQLSSRPPGVQSVTNTVDSSSSSSSSSSTSSDSDVGRHLALVPRPPGFHPFMMGVPPPQNPYSNPYAMSPQFGPPAHPGMMGQMMGAPPGFPPGAMGGGGGGGAGVGGAGGVPPGDLQRYLAQEEMRMFSEDRTPKVPLVMEHPSLRQFVILMAVLFLLALVALIITAVYFGRSASPSFNI